MPDKLPHLEAVRQLVEEEHLKLEPGGLGQRIRSAVYYDPQRPGREGDVFLFEVISNFGEGVCTLPLFEIRHQWDDADPGTSLCMVLCSPEEFVAAVRADIEQIRELRRAIDRQAAAFIHGGNPFDVFAPLAAQ